MPPKAIQIDRSSKIGIEKQLYLAVKQLIESGVWQKGTKLPSSRDLADELKVARKTVKQAYTQLCLEGYLVSLDRQGTYVQEVTLDSSAGLIQAPKKEPLSRYGAELTSMALSGRQPARGIDISLFSRCPDFDKPQFDSVRASLFKAMRAPHADQFSAEPFGCRRLRTAIANVLAPEREISCTADQVAILPGFVDALDLITRVHIDRNDGLLLEEPCYPAIRENAIAYGAQWSAVATDQEGLTVDSLIQSESGQKLIFTTPGHHFPTGGVLPFARRLKLLKWARQSGAIIVEDDYDSEFTYQGKPAPALKSLDRTDQVIYLSSFKKLVPPMFCLDFLILPQPLLAVYAQAILLSVSQPGAEVQRALASFIETGSMAKHINRLKLVYAQRRQQLMQTLEKYFGERVQITGANSGLHFLIRIDSPLSTENIVQRAADTGLEISDTRDFYAGAAPRNEFIIGFGALEDSQIEEAIHRLYVASGCE